MHVCMYVCVLVCKNTCIIHTAPRESGPSPLRHAYINMYICTHSAGSVWALEGIEPRPALKDLERLYLTHNLLDRLPDELSNLRTLKQLWINANNISNLPSTISVLGNLVCIAYVLYRIRSL